MTRGIDLTDDPVFLRRSWAVERIGWAVLGLILAAAVLGLLGPGLLPRARVEGPLTAEFDRFARWENDGVLRVRLPPGERSLWIENRYLNDVEIRRVWPDPAGVSARPGWTVLTFEATGEVDVLLEIAHRRFGPAGGRLGTSADRAVAIRQFVYP